MMIRCSDPKAQYLAHKEAIDRAIARVMESGWYILGEEVKKFEEEFAGYMEIRHCIGVGNGTDALQIALNALGVGRGNEVITVSNTAVATVAAIEMAGATPVLVDIDPHTYTIDPGCLLKAITKRTKAVVPVHLYGCPADMTAILEIANAHGLAVVEDCAQAHGARLNGKRVGTFGDAACFSFYPTKNLGALGDGGCVITNSSKLAERITLLRQYGWQKRFVSHIRGWNTRLDEIQAAILRVKLKYLDRDNVERRRLAAYYRHELAGCGIVHPKAVAHAEHVFHLYVINTPNRDDLLRYLNLKDIGAAVHYPQPIHLQQAYRHMDFQLKETETAANRILSLPLYPGMENAGISHVVEAIREFFS